MFIELTDRLTDQKILFNKNQIIDVWQCNDHTGIDTIAHNFGTSYFVRESYEEVKSKLMGEVVVSNG